MSIKKLVIKIPWLAAWGGGFYSRIINNEKHIIKNSNLKTDKIKIQVLNVKIVIILNL